MVKRGGKRRGVKRKGEDERGVEKKGEEKRGEESRGESGGVIGCFAGLASLQVCSKTITGLSHGGGSFHSLSLSVSHFLSAGFHFHVLHRRKTKSIWVFRLGTHNIILFRLRPEIVYSVCLIVCLS